MKTVVLVAAHFVPSNLAAVHRARLFAQHLEEFGWKPIILTTAPEHYAEAPDPYLQRLLGADLEILRTPAWCNRRGFRIGDVGVRAFPYHLAALRRLARSRRIDFCHITIPSNYSAPLGRLLWMLEGVPYGIDYIDPWVHRWPGVERVFSRHWASHHLSRMLEPWSVRQARLITGVAPGYFEGMLERNPEVRERAVTAAMPYGASEKDIEMARELVDKVDAFDPADGLLHVVYAGAIMPKAVETLNTLLRAFKILRDAREPLADRVRFHFIGTGHLVAGTVVPQVSPMVEALGLQGAVLEHPERMSYPLVLANLLRSHGVLILGGIEPHYTPSKAYQAAQSGRPVLATLHPESAASGFLHRALGDRFVELPTPGIPDAESAGVALRRFFQRLEAASQPPDAAALDGVSARTVAGRLAEALDQAVGGGLPLSGAG